MNNAQRPCAVQSCIGLFSYFFPQSLTLFPTFCHLFCHPFCHPFHHTLPSFNLIHLFLTLTIYNQQPVFNIQPSYPSQSSIMTIPTRHEHCSHSGTLRDHEDERSVCSDVLDHTTMDISKKMLIPANSRLRQLSTLQDFIMDLKRAKDSRSIYVANINPRVSINDLEHVFANFGPFNSCIIQHKHHRGLTSAGYAILELSDSATRSPATMLNGTRLASQKISVPPPPKRLTENSHGHTRGHGRGLGLGYGHGHGHDRQHGRQHGRQHNGREAGCGRPPLRDITPTSGHNQRL